MVCQKASDSGGPSKEDGRVDFILILLWLCLGSQCCPISLGLCCGCEHEETEVQAGQSW